MSVDDKDFIVRSAAAQVMAKAFDQEVIPTNVFMVVEGIDEDGDHIVSVCATEAPIWQQMGMLHFVLRDMESHAPCIHPRNDSEA